MKVVGTCPHPLPTTHDDGTPLDGQEGVWAGAVGARDLLVTTDHQLDDFVMAGRLDPTLAGGDAPMQDQNTI